MRVYAGERDPDTGHGRVWVIHDLPRPDIHEVVEILGELNKLMEFRRDGSVGDDYERRRAATIARKDEIVAQLKAAEDAPRPVELVHHAERCWADHFDWGTDDAGTADLARSIVSREIGEVAPSAVYLRFAADIISELDHRSFRLPASEVWDWIEANRDLVQRELFDQLPPPDSDPSVPALSVAESHTHADHQEPVELSEASGSAVVRACEQAWRDIQAHHPDLPDVVVILGSGVERGRLVKLGHWWSGRWIADGQARGEVLLAGEALHLAPAEVFEVLLHEAAHGINAARRIPDTSRGGRYHNRRFAATASEVLLHAELLPPYGYAATKLTPEAEKRYAATIERLGETMRIARNIGRDVRLGTGAEEGLEGGRDADGQDRGGRRREVTARCECGRQFRMAPSVYEQGPVVCGHCGSAFRDVAQRNVEREPDASVIDDTFLIRRRAALDAEASAGFAPSPRVVAVLDEERARLAAALAAAPDGDSALLSPIHRRLMLIDELLAASGHHLASEPVPVTELQREGVGQLLDGRAPPGELAAVARWYETFGTLHEQPMPPGTDPQERVDVARSLLKADGTLTGPRLAVGETELLVGDRVINTRDVPAFGLAAGTPGTVEHVDPDHGEARIDFATWGRLELSVTQMLEAGLGHDYVAHDDGVAIDQADVADRLFVEASRVEPGVGW